MYIKKYLSKTFHNFKIHSIANINFLVWGMTIICQAKCLWRNLILLKQETLICMTDICPGIDFRLKVIPSWMEKKSFLCKCYHRIPVSIKTGLRSLNWVVSNKKHQQTRNAAQFWATEVFKLSYLSSKKLCNETSCIKPIPEVEYVRQRFQFFKNM